MNGAEADQGQYGQRESPLRRGSRQGSVKPSGNGICFSHPQRCRRRQDRVFGGRSSARSRSRYGPVELERAVPGIGGRLDVSQPNHRPLLPRESNPAGPYSPGWDENSVWATSGGTRSATRIAPGSTRWALRWGPTEADAARSDCNHHEVYGDAMMESKRAANSKVIQMPLRPALREAK